jgi:serine/threonine-protein kinase HipA
MNLVACLDGRVAGIVELIGSRAAFTYETSWLNAPGLYPLSQSLPLQSMPIRGKSVLNFLWGLLPDNQRTLDGWARQFHVSARNPVALLSHVGEDCAGAVQFVKKERLPEIIDAVHRAPSVDWLTEREFEQRIARLVADGSEGRLTPDEGQFSLSGAQSKTALFYDAPNNRWGVPRGRTPTTHILKPVTNSFDGFAENEHFCLSLARRLGLPAAATQWRLIANIPTFIAERYDRAQINGSWRRIHQEDCCQALDVSPENKYQNDGGPGFSDIMTLLNSSDEPAADRDRLMKTACLFYLLAATDTHGKNFSLIYAEGTQRASMRLAPLYDIASAWPYTRRIPAQKMKLAMRYGSHYKLREIQPRHFDELARSCGYSAERIHEMLASLVDQLPDQAASLLRELETTGMNRIVLGSLVDGIARQCKALHSRLTAT